MKILLVSLLLLFKSVYGAPIFNENVALNSGAQVIWPDSHDALTYYYVPKGLKTVDQYQWGFYVRKNVLNIGFTSDVDENKLELSRQELERKLGRRMKLILPELAEGSIEIGNIFKDFIQTQECWQNREAGDAYLLYCRLTLSPEGEDVFLPVFSRKGVVALSSTFKAKGYLRRLDGALEPFEMTLGLPLVFKKPKFQ